MRTIRLEDLIDARGLSKGQTPAEQRLAGYLGAIAKASSLHPAGTPVITGLACRRRPRNRKCTGHIAVTRQADEESIHWRCTSCHDEGRVAGWRGGSNDLSELLQNHDASVVELTVARLSAEVYAALMDDRVRDGEADRLLYSATAPDEHVELRGSLDELEDLYESTCAVANHVPRGALQRRLDRACELLRNAIQPPAPQRGPGPTRDETSSLVEVATRGLALTQEEREGLASYARELDRMLGPSGFLSPEKLTASVREMGEAIILGRRIRVVLAVNSVDYKHLSIFLLTLQDTLEKLETFAQQSPNACLNLYIQFITGLGQIADRIHCGENELGDFIEEVTLAAFELAPRLSGGVSELRPLLSELVVQWMRDSCCAFYFLPNALDKLGLKPRNRNWLRKEIERMGSREGRKQEALDLLGELG